MERVVEIFTDGSSSGNSEGPGGWGIVMRYGEHEKTLAGGELVTTNNRMEMMAAIMGLEELKRPSRVLITTDSEYVQKGITEWIHNWKKRNWRTSSKKPVKNADLWRRLDELASSHEVSWAWVRGHDGHPENERADELAGIGKRLVVEHGPSARLVNGVLERVSEPGAPEPHPEPALAAGP